MTTTTAPLVDLRMLTRYTAWANALLYERLATAPQDVVAVTRPGPLGGILGMLGHIHVVGLIWKAHLTGESHGFESRNFDQPRPLAELAPMQAAQDRWYIDFADREPDERLARTIHFSFVGGGPGTMRAADMLMHVVTHGSYHRGLLRRGHAVCLRRTPADHGPARLLAGRGAGDVTQHGGAPDRAGERAKTVGQVFAILCLAGILLVLLHKAYSDFSALREDHPGIAFWPALARYIFRNLAGG
jgi:uncharacterized damage-inducible protein DinB